MSSLKKALNYLQAGYTSGIFGYPRVDNDFIAENKGFDLFPHPTLAPINPTLKPLTGKQTIRVEKNELILFLSSVGIISPSQIEGVFNYIEYYLDDQLKFKNEVLQKEALMVIEFFNQYLKENNLTDGKLIAQERNLALEAKRSWDHSRIFKVPRISFFSKGREKKTLKAYLLKKYNKKEGVIDLKEGLRKGLETFRDEVMIPQSNVTPLSVRTQEEKENEELQSIKGVINV